MANSNEDNNERVCDTGRDRDLSRRGERSICFSEGSVHDCNVDHGYKRRKSSNCRVYVSNIIYEFRCQDLKDLFRNNVGNVNFVELFVDEAGKPKGCGIVEFSDTSSVKKCLEVMHRYDLQGRKLVIKEDFGNVRNKHGIIVNGQAEGRSVRDRNSDKIWDNREGCRVGVNSDAGGHWDSSRPSLLGNILGAQSAGTAVPLEFKWGNTYGLTPQFLESLDIHKPLTNRVFVTNLDCKVDAKKLREVFKLCGKVSDIEMYHDKDGNSRGFAVVEYDHPVESVQAISMLHNQMLYERQITVRMDRDVPLTLPDGLKAVGVGLGMNGEPLRDVSRNMLVTDVSTVSERGADRAVLGPNRGPSLLGAVPNTGMHALPSDLSSTLQSVLNTPALIGQPTAELNGSLDGDIGFSNPTSSLSSLVCSLTQNHSLAAVSGALRDVNMGCGLGNNMGNNRMMGRCMGLTNSNRDYGRDDSTASNDGRDGGMGDCNMGATGNQGGASNPDSLDNQGGIGDLDGTINYGFQKGTNNSSVKNISGYSNTVIVSNLPISATWKMLKEKFSNAGEVMFVKMKSKDTAIIRFRNEWQAERAISILFR